MNKLLTSRLRFMDVLFILFSILLGLQCTVHAATSVKSTDKEIRSLVETEVTNLINKKTTKGAVVSIIKDDKSILCRGYGYADEKNGILASEESTAFRIGSVSKTFVALSAMQLVQSGKLDMNAPITKYLDQDFPKFKYPITMQNLLTHTAGFETMNAGLFIAADEKAKPLKKVLIKYKPNQIFKPGEVAAYSNYGISLAGYIIERIYGKPYYEYANENIFKPLKMSNSTFKQDTILTPIVSTGYGIDGKERAEGKVNLYPSGSISTTAKDMAKYMSFLLNEEDNNILTSNIKQKMFSQQFTMYRNFVGLGYVWGRYERNGHYIYAHEGGTDNFSSVLFLCPDENLGIFISCNSSIDVAFILEKAIDTVYGKESPIKENKTKLSKSSENISGYYLPTTSSFNTAEKFYNVFSIMHIEGNSRDGFKFNGKELLGLPDGLYYHPELGSLKFIEKNGRHYLTNNESFSFIRVPLYEGVKWQLFVTLFFIITTIIGFVISLIIFIKSARNKDKKKIFLSLPGIFLFLAIAITITKTIVFLDNLNFASVECFIDFLKLSAISITFIGLWELICTIYLWIKKRNKYVAIFYTSWCISFVLFVTWLIQINLL